MTAATPLDHLAATDLIMNPSPPESPERKEKASEAPSSPETPTASLPNSYVADNQRVDDSSKLKTFLSILRKYATALACLLRSTVFGNTVLIIRISLDLSASQTLHPSDSLYRRSSLNQLQILVSDKVKMTLLSLLTFGESTGITSIGLRRSSGQYRCANRNSTLLREVFSIGDSDDGLGRMLAVLRFWFTKDLV